MDCAHLLRLGLLLLAVAAPHPNIAMSSIGPTEGAQDSSSGKTTVTVYHCKGCNNNTCQSERDDFQNFDIIIKTQNKMFSNGIIELVTNKTHVTVCFGQENSFLEGIYGIVWEKSGGAGLSCGVLKSGENGRGDISTEEKKICCEVETNLWQPNPTLKWFNKPSGPKVSTQTTDISGNPEFLTSKKTSNGILFAFLFVGVLTGCAITYYFLRLRRSPAFRKDRRTPDKEHLTHA